MKGQVRMQGTRHNPIQHQSCLSSDDQDIPPLAQQAAFPLDWKKSITFLQKGTLP